MCSSLNLRSKNKENWVLNGVRHDVDVFGSENSPKPIRKQTTNPFEDADSNAIGHLEPIQVEF